MNPKLKIYGVVVGIFILGASAGGAAGYATASKQLAEVLGDDRPALGEARRFAAMARELDLSRDQRKQVREVMDRHRDESRKLMREMMDRCGGGLQEQRARVDREIQALLDAEQQKRFRELAEKRGKLFPFGGPAGRHRKGD